MVHYTWWFGSGFLGYCDFFGEKLAWALGITSPKYYYEIQEAKRMIKEEEERKTRLDAEMAGWVEGGGGIVESQEAVRSKDLGVED